MDKLLREEPQFYPGPDSNTILMHIALMGSAPLSLSSPGKSLALRQVRTTGQEHLCPGSSATPPPTLIFLHSSLSKTVLQAHVGPDSHRYNVCWGILKVEAVSSKPAAHSSACLLPEAAQ